jgi:flagellin
MLPSYITEDVMAASILNNISALQATRQLGITNAGMGKTIQRLTTGKRINNAADDATGLATANNFSADALVATEQRKLENQTFFEESAKDGYLDEATNLIMRAVVLAAGGNKSAAEMSAVSTLAINAAAKGLSTIGTVSDLASASAALTTIGASRSTIASAMAKAQSNANLYGIEAENKTAQMSNIMDADIGAEVVSLTKWQILSQSGISALGNANQASQTVLGLLR